MSNSVEEFLGRTVVVTGASTGIGHAVARRFLALGANVVAHWYAEESGAEALLHEPNGDRCHLVQADLSLVSEARRMFSVIDEVVSPVDILVNNAGVTTWTRDIAAVSEKDWGELIDLDLRGTFFCSMEAASRMRGHRGGSVVNVSSNLSHLSVPHLSLYGFAKQAVNALTSHLAVELAVDGIRVNGIAPGPTAVARTLKDDPEFRTRWRDFIPLGRVAEVDDIVEPIVFLTSQKAKYVTGQTLFVDGGWSQRGWSPPAESMRLDWGGN